MSTSKLNAVDTSVKYSGEKKKDERYASMVQIFF